MGFLSKLFGTDGAYKQAVNDLNEAKDYEMNYYKSLASMDQLQRSENQAALAEARELLTASTKRSAGSAAVTGATPQAVALEKEAATKALADITTGIAKNASVTKDQAMNNYIDANRQYTQAINNVRTQQAQAESDALSGLLGAGIGAASTILTGGLAGGKGGKV